MSFARLLPLLLLVPALSFADADKNFKISPDQFFAGKMIEPIADMAVSVDGSMIISEKPSFPLKINTMYWRHKQGPKEYVWMAGTVNPENYKKLHAFSLSQNQLDSREVAALRFYGSQNAKAFQDEPDIYFDKQYLYSPRVPKLFFIKNGRWQMLREVEMPGIIQVKGDVKDLAIRSDSFTSDSGQTIFHPVSLGAHTLILSAPGYLPVAEIAFVKSGELTEVPLELPKSVESSAQKGKFTTVTFESLEACTSLEEVEALFDKFTDDIQKSVSRVNMDEFNEFYPKRKDASVVGLMSADPAYAKYAIAYDGKREEAKSLWRESKMPGVKRISSALRMKLDELQALPLVDTLEATTVTPVYGFKNSDSTSDRITEVKLKFGKEGGRIDVEWVGVALGIEADSLYTWLNERRGNVKIVFSLQNNKPVWIYKESVIPTRHHYRYKKVTFVVDGTEYGAQGDIVLPQYILDEREVQEWLNAKPEVKTEAPEVKPEVPVVQLDSVMFTEMAPDIPRVIRDRIHGNVAMIDSGSFRYKGRVVALSPYAIMTTEFTQKMLEVAMSKVDSAKRIPNKATFKDPLIPVHNVNWDDARAVCKVLGGDLPTEAQWEYAARAGGNEGAIWSNDEHPDPGVYAVYRINSYNAPKGSPEYGPQKVASKKPNAWGMYDMSGNVAEWILDKYFMFSFMIEPSNPSGAMFGSSHVYKGGSWKDKEKALNVTASDDEDPRYWSETIGFRCVFPRDIIKE